LTPRGPPLSMVCMAPMSPFVGWVRMVRQERHQLLLAIPSELANLLQIGPGSYLLLSPGPDGAITARPMARKWIPPTCNPALTRPETPEAPQEVLPDA